MTVSQPWPDPARDPELPARSVPYVLGGGAVILLASTGHVLASRADTGASSVLGLVVGTGLAGVLAVGGLLAVLVRPPTGDRARVVLAAGLGLVVASAVAAAAVTGDVASSGLTGLAMVTAVAFGDSRWVAGFVSASALAWGGVVLASAWPEQAVAPVLVVLAAAGLAALLEAYRRRTLREFRASQEAWEKGRATDVTTGLASREGLALAGARMVESARRQGDAVHCVFVEVSGLDVVVDKLGPESRDDAMAAVAEALAGGIRGTDVAARWDAEVFCVVGPGVGVSPLELERRIHERLTAEPPVPPEVWSPRVTAAAATLPPWEDGNLSTLLGLGEQVMQVRRVLRGGRPRARRADLPHSGFSD